MIEHDEGIHDRRRRGRWNPAEEGMRSDLTSLPVETSVVGSVHETVGNDEDGEILVEHAFRYRGSLSGRLFWPQERRLRLWRVEFVVSEVEGQRWST